VKDKMPQYTANATRRIATRTPAASTHKTGVDFNHSGVSRYVQLATLFTRRIESGAWPVGAQIPTVDKLSAECGVARATVRQALDILEARQLIARYRARGTFVMRQPQEQLWCEVSTNWSGMLLAPAGATIEVLSVERGTQPPNLMHKIGRPAPSYRHWHRLHWRQETPYHVGNVYIDERLCARIPRASLESKTSMRILKDLPGLKIAEARQTLTVGTADIETAALLKIPLNAPVAHVHRSVVDAAGCLVFVGDGIYRGDVVRLEIKLK
jgi:GntR family transcriptional regulator